MIGITVQSLIILASLVSELAGRGVQNDPPHTLHLSPLRVKDSYLIIDIFDKFSFSDILRRCLSHLNEA